MKLNIGGGATKLDGYEVVDRKNGQEAFPLKYHDDTISEIRASHILEHFNYVDAKKALKEWVRVLEPGGLLQIAVPDFDKIIEVKKTGDDKWRFYASGGQIDSNDQHYSMWDKSTLYCYLHECGLEEIETWKGDERDTSSHPVSLNLQGRKQKARCTELQTSDIEAEFSGVPKGKRPAKIGAVLSCPRLGWNDFWGEAISAFSPLGISISRYSGAFWDQGIQNALENAVRDNLDFVITVDYDSVFSHEHVDKLCKTIIADSDIDALSSLQNQRETGMLMLSGVKTEEGPNGKQRLNVSDLKPFQAKTAHFGLTIIRVDALRDLPKPWFRHQPDKDGTYRGDDRLDADIWFWHQWRKHDRTLYIHPDVRIGHLEVMVSGLDDEFQPHHWNVKTWREMQQKKLIGNFDMSKDK